MKQKILEENTHLQSLYLYLVKEKLITPQDFWTFHYKPVNLFCFVFFIFYKNLIQINKSFLG